jgi:type I restriction enzyme R subunit
MKSFFMRFRLKTSLETLMSELPSFLSEHLAQIPALQLLQNLGYVYLRQQEIHLERDGNLSNVLLENILEKQLRRLNRINFKGQEREFSDANIQSAIQTLKDVAMTDGPIRANERVYDLLSLGRSFEQKIDGDAKSFTLNYVDWKRPENNVFHVADEFEVECARSGKTRRVDIALFVNGIPFVVIECQQPGEKNAIETAIARHLLNHTDEYIPRLLAYSQILLAINRDEAKYATTGTPIQRWSQWKEETDLSDEVRRLVNKPLTKEFKEKLFADRFAYARRYFDESEEKERPVTEQDLAIYRLLRPERLIELTRQFIVFDGGRKKIARPQQYFAVKKTIDRIKRVGADGDRDAGDARDARDANTARNGGLIWHTQGSGKSLTMVMLAKAIALEESIPDPRIVLVTDRVDLDDQIWGTFHSCGKEPVKATTGRHLLELLAQRKSAIITTVIDKFATAVKASNYQNDSRNIFVLVDESHRSQYGEANARMRRTLPNACYIGFTGTPLKQKDKNTAAKFGGFIDAYTIDEAVRDKAVTPLLYEGRHIPQQVEERALNTWFERVARPLSAERRRDLKRKMSSHTRLNLADQRIFMIACDLSEHFDKNVPKPFKAQLATESKLAALKYKQYLDEIGLVSSEVLISAPDTREGDGASTPPERAGKAGDAEIQAFWKRMMERYGGEKEYNRAIIEAFNKNDQPEIIIVVDKLLTGFDAPRNTVLYLDKMLHGHGLLQAIARVNRLHEGKEFGFIVDYFGVLHELNEALDLYSSLPEFERDDLALTLTDISEVTVQLPQRHAELREIFPDASRQDEETFERFLADEDRREYFYEKFSAFNRTMSVAFSSARFIRETSDERLKQYRQDLIFFQKLRMRLKRRYAEELDFQEYEAKVQSLLDKHVSANEALRITPLVNIFDKEKFQAEVDLLDSAAAQADTIAYRTKLAITEKLEEDPLYFRRFSKILEGVIEEWRNQRITDADYLNKAIAIWGAAQEGASDALPRELQNDEAGGAFYGAIIGVFNRMKTPLANAREIALEAALEIDRIIQKNRVVDWTSKIDAQNEISNEIDDYLYALKKARGVDLSADEMDSIIADALKIAISKYA